MWYPTIVPGLIYVLSLFFLRVAKAVSSVPRSTVATSRVMFAKIAASTGCAVGALSTRWGRPCVAVAELESTQFSDIVATSEFIESNCKTVLGACRNTGRLLYRGETRFSSKLATLVKEYKSDLFSPETYKSDSVASGVAAADFFKFLDRAVLDGKLISSGHIATSSQKDASMWGPLFSIWPLDAEFQFGTFRKYRTFWSDDWSTPQGAPLGVGAFFWRSEPRLALFLKSNLVVNSGLEASLSSEHEIVFSAPKGYVAVPVGFENRLLECLRIDAFQPEIRPLRGGQMELDDLPRRLNATGFSPEFGY